MTDTSDSFDAVDRLVGGYLLLTVATQLFPHRAATWPLLVLGHVGIGWLLVSGAAGRLRRRLTRGPDDGPGRLGAARVLLDWYPLLLFPFLYWELPVLMGAIWDGRYFDSRVMGWEQALFGGQPSTTLARRFDSLILSELLHGAYLSYYFLIYAPLFVLYVRRRWESYASALFALLLGLLGTYVVFIAFPVQGPRYLFPAPGGGLESGPVYRLAHRVLEAGSSRGAAFPSAHAAIGALQTVSAIRYLPSAAPLLAVLTAGLSVGAVYGGFHYGVDIVTGLATGVLLGVVAPWLRRRLL